MIDYYQVVEIARSFANNPKMSMQLSTDEKHIVKKDSGEIFDTIEGFADFLRRDLHCDFEVIYSDALDNVIYRCRECGTVIFTNDSYDEYDENLCCPSCGGYKTHFKYWTQSDIDADEKKQKALAMYKEDMLEQQAAYERKKQTGLCFNELWKKKFRFKDVYYELVLNCNNALRESLKGLTLSINKFERCEPDSLSFVCKKFTRIPLSPYSFYIQCIFPYQKKTPKELRKYLPWQKKN